MEYMSNAEIAFSAWLVVKAALLPFVYFGKKILKPKPGLDRTLYMAWLILTFVPSGICAFQVASLASGHGYRMEIRNIFLFSMTVMDVFISSITLAILTIRRSRRGAGKT